MQSYSVALIDAKWIEETNKPEEQMQKEGSNRYNMNPRYKRTTALINNWHSPLTSYSNGDIRTRTHIHMVNRAEGRRYFQRNSTRGKWRRRRLVHHHNSPPPSHRIDCICRVPSAECRKFNIYRWALSISDPKNWNIFRLNVIRRIVSHNFGTQTQDEQHQWAAHSSYFPQCSHHLTSGLLAAPFYLLFIFIFCMVCHLLAVCGSYMNFDVLDRYRQSTFDQNTLEQWLDSAKTSKTLLEHRCRKNDGPCGII